VDGLEADGTHATQKGPLAQALTSEYPRAINVNKPFRGTYPVSK